MSEKSLSKRVAAGIGWSYAERILSQIISLLVSIVLARLLDPAHYGTIAIVTVFISICDALVNGGFGNALVQKKDAKDIDFNSICWLSIGVASALYIVLFIGAPLIAAFYENNLLTAIVRVMGIRFLFTAFNSVQQAYVQKKMIFKKSFLASWGSAIVSGVIGIVMAVAGFGVWALVAQYLSHTIVGTAVLFLAIKWKPKLEMSGNSVKDLWRYGAKVMASTLVYTLKDNIRTLVIGKRFTTDDLAQYNQGQKYPSLLVLDIVEALGRVLFPVLSEEQSGRAAIKTYMRKSIRISSYILVPMIIGLYAVADTFVGVILTDKWLPCVPYMRILCIVYITRSMSAVFQKAIMAIGKSGVSLLHEIITSALTIVLLVLAVFVYDSIDLIAWSYVLVMVVGILYYSYVVNKEFAYRYFEIAVDYMPPILLSVVMGLCAYAVGFIQLPSVLKLVLQVLTGAAVYVVLSILFKMDSFLYLKNFLQSTMKRK